MEGVQGVNGTAVDQCDWSPVPISSCLLVIHVCL